MTKMKYATVEDFIQAAQSGKMKNLEVVVDNDCVDAYVGNKKVYKFQGAGPQEALVILLVGLGINATFP